MWARAIDADEKNNLWFYPNCPAFVAGYLNNILPQPDTSFGNQSQKYMIRYNDTYIVSSACNTPTRFEAHYFVARTNVPMPVDFSIPDSRANIMNLIGMGFAQKNIAISSDTPTAENIGLHGEDFDVINAANFSHYYRRYRRTKFSLDPGRTKRFYVKRGWKKYNTMDDFALLGPGETLTVGRVPFLIKKGDKFMFFRMMSEPVGVQQPPERTVLSATTTRSTPCAILGYKHRMQTMKIPLNASDVLYDLSAVIDDTYGFDDLVSKAQIRPMVDQDVVVGTELDSVPIIT